MKHLLFILALICATTLKAENDTLVSATINPTHYYIDANNQDPHTIITWNDATDVTSVTLFVFGFPFELVRDSEYFITPIDSTTAKLSFEQDLKNFTKTKEMAFFDWEFLIEFDKGSPCVFTIIPEVTISYGVYFWVIDPWGNDVDDAILTFDGLELEKGDYFAGMYEPGAYAYNIRKNGYQTHYDTILVYDPVSVVITLFPDGYTNISDNIELVKSIYPNPTTDVINLEFKSKEQTVVEIFALNGKLVKSLIVNENQISIDVSNLVNGMYLIKTSTKNNTQVSRFVKK